MKTQFKIMFFTAIIILIAGCTEDDVLDFQTIDPEPNKAQVEVIVPFEANVLGETVGFDVNATDCEGYLARVIVDANGTATHMGKVSTTFNFCAGGPPDPNIEESVMTYTGGYSELIAANGDVLNIYISGGAIIDGRKDEHPEYVSDYWEGTIEVLGGTGRFEGATGELTADGYSSNLDDFSHHHFYGKITLIKGKR